MENFFTKNNCFYFKDKPKICLSEYKDIASEYLTNFTYGDSVLKLNIIKNNKYVNDGFNIVIDYEYNINIEYTSDRALVYALKCLNSLPSKKIVGWSLPIGIYEARPSLKIRGIIEGFYGKPYSEEEREDLIDTIFNLRMNSYFYAPKDDLYHLKLWRDSYPKKELENLKNLIELCNKKYVDFYYCISPGKDYKFYSDEDYRALKEKIKSIISLGCKKFALLMDDIDFSLSEIDKEEFKTAGIAHSMLTNKLFDFLKKELNKDTSLIFCPTEYIQTWDTDYRTELRVNLNDNIKIFWTGYNTVAEAITEQDCYNVKKIFNKNLILWDNYPVNDFNPKKRIYLGAIKNRSPKISLYNEGMLSNPMQQWYLSKIAIYTSAQFMFNCENYNSEESLKDAAKYYFGKKYYKAALTFFRLHNSTVMCREDFAVQEMYKNSNFTELLKHYEKIKCAVNQLRSFDNKKMIEQLIPYFDYFDIEYELFQQIIKNNVNENTVFLLQNNGVVSSNQYILEYIKSNKLINNFSEIIIDKDRQRYFLMAGNNG